jgi:hypothetical protein
MIAVAAHDLVPLVHKTAHGFLILHIHSPTGKLAPHQAAQSVGPVEGARVEDLLVKPRPVEPRRQGKLDVVAERLVAGRGVDAIGVEALVKDEPLEYGPVVGLSTAMLERQAAGTVSSPASPVAPPQLWNQPQTATRHSGSTRIRAGNPGADVRAGEGPRGTAS